MRYLIDDILFGDVDKVNPNQVTLKKVRKPRCNRKRYLVVILNGGEAVTDQSETVAISIFCQS